MRNPFRRRRASAPVEGRVLQWPFDVGPPAYAPTVSSVEDAVSLIPLYACVRLIADGIASLPLQTFREVGDGEAVKLPPGPLLSRPAAVGTRYDWLFACMSSLLLEGNAFGLITSRDGYEYPTGIEWLPPSCVYIDERTPGGVYYYEGREIPREQLVHIRAFVLAGCLRGVSPLRAFAESIGLGAAMTTYGGTWFGNGGIPPGTFKNDAVEVGDDDARRIREKLVESIRTRKPLVYGRDWTYSPLSVPPEEAQFVMSTQLNATQIAAIYGVPPERVGGATSGGSLTYATVEQNEISFGSSTIRPWAERLEQVFTGLLPARQYVKFNLDAPIRSDLKTRYEVYQIARVIGMRNVDELRRLEELPPLPNGEGEDYSPLKASTPAPAADPTPALPPANQPPTRPRAVS